MAFYNLFVGSEAHISVKNNQLKLKNIEKEEIYPVEDINSIIIENLQSSITTFTLSKLAQSKVVVYLCDEKHLPCAYLLPYYSHFSQSKIFQTQIDLPAPLRKNLWKETVKHKIQNQNICLKLCDKKEKLSSYINKIKSDDATNMEAVSASVYFKELFGDKFTRAQDNSINSALNYGYAILRGAVARNIVSHGLLPFLGLKHSNTFNNYNLADDLMEVFRPFVDLCVYENYDLKFNKDYKMILFDILNADCEIDGAKYSLSYAVELFIQSFSLSLSEKKDVLKFPKLLKLKRHEYE